MPSDFAATYYLNESVRTEIADYCKGRWITLEGGARGSRVFLRYWKDRSPLTVSSPRTFRIY